MKSSRTGGLDRSRRTKISALQALGLALAAMVGCQLLIWFYVDPGARYYASAPVFFFERAFFRSHYHRSGGLLEYGSGFLAQLDHEPWLGALVFAVMLVALAFCFRTVLERTVGAAGLVWIWPSLVLLGLYAQYLPPAWLIAGGLALAAGGWLGWVAWNPTSGRGRLAALLGLAASLYWVGGIWVCLLFLSVVAAIELTLRVPALKAPTRGRDAGSRLSKPNPALVWWWWFWSRGVQISLSVLVLILMAWTFAPERRALLRIQSEAERGHWNGVLGAATGLHEYPVQARLQVNRALQHLGRLNSELFCHPQPSGVDLLASMADGLFACAPLSDTLLELGQVNLAEHYAHEAMEFRGERPELLWRLARINMVKERPEAARVFLSRLRQAPFHRGQADAWLEAIERDRSLANQAEIVHLRSLRPSRDWVERVFPTEPLLLRLLEANRRNRMASDYLMAHYLLTRQPEALLQHLAHRDDLAGSGLPRHLAEAVVSLHPVGPNQAPGSPAPATDPEIARRFELFRRAALSPNPVQAPPPALEREFGDTYWYYARYGQTHGRTHGQTASRK